MPRSDDEIEEGPATPGGVGEDADGGARRAFTDTVRKVVLTGLGAVFLTEEGARKVARDWKLPKEIVGYVTSQASGAKDEFVRVLSSMSVEVHAEIRLKPAKGGHVEPEVKVSSAKPRARRKDDQEAGE